VALATDDEGVSRSEISREFAKAAEDQDLGYLQLKTMARTSLQFAFVAGASLWSDARKFTPVDSVRDRRCHPQAEFDGMSAIPAGSEKAKLQWNLEEQLNAL